jgi:DNA modification methylase
MSTKPEPVLRHFFRMFIDENSTVLDPTCWSETALRAAESLRAAYVLGIEQNKDFAERATIALEESRRSNKPADAPTTPHGNSGGAEPLASAGLT